MDGDLPDGLSPDVRDAAKTLIELAKREGWTIGSVRLRAGCISLSATSPVGGGFHFSCGEHEFISRLKDALLKTSSAEQV